MPSGEDEAICIRHWDYSESSQTVGVFTRSAGVVRALARGSRRQGGRHSGGIDLLTHARATLTQRPGTDLANLDVWDLVDGFPMLRRRRRASQIAFYLAELVGRFFQPGDPHPQVFDALVGALSRLGATNRDAPDSMLLLWFQWVVLKESGYQPLLGRPASEDELLHFEPRNGGALVPSPTPTSWRVRRSTIDFIARVLCDEVPEHPVDDLDSLDRSNRLFAAYIREVLGDEPLTMRELFGRLDPRGAQRQP